MISNQWGLGRSQNIGNNTSLGLSFAEFSWAAGVSLFLGVPDSVFWGGREVWGGSSSEADQDCADDCEGDSEEFPGCYFFFEEEPCEKDDEDGRHLVVDGGPARCFVFESCNPEDRREEGAEEGHGDGDFPDVAPFEGNGEVFSLAAEEGEQAEADSRHGEAKSGDPDE